jgi:hypothetical protein
MRTWTTHDHIAAPVEEVWEVLVNFNRNRKRRRNAGRITLSPPGPLAAGTRVEIGRDGKTVMTVDEFVPPKNLTLSVVTGKTTGESRFVLHEAGHHTYLEHTLRLELRGLRRLFAFMIARSLRDELRALRYRIEALPRANAPSLDIPNPPPPASLE